MEGLKVNFLLFLEKNNLSLILYYEFKSIELYYLMSNEDFLLSKSILK